MRTIGLVLPAIVAAAMATTAWGAGIVRPGSVKLQDMRLETPAGWRLAQDAQDGDTLIALFSDGRAMVRVYVKRGTGHDARATFVNGSRVTREQYQSTQGRHAWSMLETRMDARSGGTVAHVASFWTTYRGNTYYGYGSAADIETARANVKTFLEQLN